MKKKSFKQRLFSLIYPKITILCSQILIGENKIIILRDTDPKITILFHKILLALLKLFIFTTFEGTTKD